LKDLPYLGGVKYGHMKEPFSLEELTSSNDIMFMERSLPNALVPGRNVGIKVQNAGFSDKLTWALGAFRESNDLDEGYQDVYHLTARLTGLPWYAEEGRKLIHLGLSYIHAFNEDDAPLRFEASPESSLVAISFVDTGDIPARDADFFNPEIALILGPFSLQGEYIYTRIIAADGSDLDFYSYYVQSSYFITGEHRKYKKAEAIFSAVEPLQPFNPPRGSWGALELALRYSSIDLDDEWVRGGKLEDFTAGLNWHLSKSVKLMFNYIRADLSGVGESDIFQSRFQVIF
ncbi:MAG: porin, partial [Desulforhabdus sp.]|nr:porin [Desulforhabdus sp.]